MSKKYTEYKGLDLSQSAKDVQKKWHEDMTFEKSVTSREGKPPFVFYEGPPSANGMPGIHHVMARAIKDIFCRYKTQKGFQVKRKAGWDTHGLPIELSVEKTLGITKEDIGKKITVEEYNLACRRDVMKYTDKWAELTEKMGYWVDMEHPYITYDNKYIESVWYLLKKLYSGDNPLKQNLLYKNFSIQPYSPAAGTGLSSHELNQPGCYRNVKDTSCVAQFKINWEKTKIANSSQAVLRIYDEINGNDSFLLAWTTTPWTLPSNTALAVGREISYLAVYTFNPYTFIPITVILAKESFSKYFTLSNGINSNALKVGNHNTVLVGSKIENPEYYYNPDWVIENKLNEKGRVAEWKIIAELKGSDLQGVVYDQLMPFEGTKKVENAFRVIVDDNDFVTTEDGTGIVHIAPTFGAEDFKIAMKSNPTIPPMVVERLGGLLPDEPLVDLKGRFISEIKDDTFPLSGKYVKEAYYSEEEKAIELQEQQEKLKTIIPKLDKYLSVDELITLKLKMENKVFKIEKYEHSYPHCWRTDKPVLYYPLQSWFIKTTAAQERMVELNETINWKPESTGIGRFGNWLENLQDWNLSRSRYWGIPLPIWRNDPARWDNKKIEKCIGSIDELRQSSAYFITEKMDKISQGNSRPSGLALSALRHVYESRGEKVNFDLWIENHITKGNIVLLSSINRSELDLHRPFIDYVFFYEEGEIIVREPDLIDVWFDSGAMPYAQLHYPFENKELIDDRKYFPADFIAEGVDQTRGWFFTLHAIATMCFDSVAFKNVVSNGLVLDKNGQKMSKRLGNAVDPFSTIEKYGPDATRWYLITNAAPWDNLKFDVEGITEVQRRFFGTLHNTYSFFALYANVDGFHYSEAEIPLDERTEIDRWILSELNTLIKKTDEAYAEYEPHRAGRLIEEFVDAHLSNWYVRLCRRRFWKGEYSTDKIAAYQTLYRCLEVIAQLSAPIAPFFMDRLYTDLGTVTGRAKGSVHLGDFPVADSALVDKDLEERMELAQKISSMVLSIRKKENIRVRQPLERIQIPVLDESYKAKIEAVKDLILSEVNVKSLEFVRESDTQIVKNLKLNFKTLGKKAGKHMKAVQAFAAEHTQALIAGIEKEGKFEIQVEGEAIVLEGEDVEIMPVDIPGWKVANEGQLTVALDVTLTEGLKEEGIARELVNRIQNLRKEINLDVTDKINLKIQRNSAINSAINNNLNYICAETLTSLLELVDNVDANTSAEVELTEEIKTLITITKLN